MRHHPAPPTRDFPDLLARFATLRAMDGTDLDAVLARSIVVSFDRDEQPARPGDACSVCWLVVSGELRVTQVSRSGRELTLYSVLPGQMCALTTLCLFTGQPFPAHITVAEDTVAVGIPQAEFQRLVAEDEHWRKFAFAASWERVDDLLTVLDDIVMTDVPTRLAGAILTAQADGEVRLTHSRLAAEIGSTREVVSRLLKRWENTGIVTLSRGLIRVDDLDAVWRLSQR